MADPEEVVCDDEQKCRALVIEDSELDSTVLELFLERKNMSVTFTDDGLKAWNLINESEPFDLVFLDLMLPGTNGFKLLAQMRSKKGWKEVPIIVVSGLGESHNVKEAIALGASSYIHKPYDFRKLRDVVDRFIRSVSRKPF